MGDRPALRNPGCPSMSQDPAARVCGLPPLAELRRALIEAAPGQYGDRLLRLVAAAVEAPTSLLAVVDSGHEICKGAYGLPPSLALDLAKPLGMGAASCLATTADL